MSRACREAVRSTLYIGVASQYTAEHNSKIKDTSVTKKVDHYNAIKAMGRSDLFLKLEIIKKAVGVTAILISMWFGVMAMAYSLLFTSVASQIINSWPNRKLLKYGYLQQLKDILPGIAVAVVMGCCILPFQLLPLPNLIIVIIQIVAGVEIYIWLSRLFKLESFYYVWDMLKDWRKKRKEKQGE